MTTMECQMCGWEFDPSTTRDGCAELGVENTCAECLREMWDAIGSGTVDAVIKSLLAAHEKADEPSP